MSGLSWFGLINIDLYRESEDLFITLKVIKIIFCLHSSETEVVNESIRDNSQLQFLTYVRTMPLILANSYQITSILHTVLSTITVSVFIERKKFEPPLPRSPSPFFGYFGVFFSETLGHRFQPI